MTVLRIVPNIGSADPHQVGQFYQRLFGLDPVMDRGWIVTLAGRTSAVPQISAAQEGGSGAPVPTISIEVDDVEAVHAAAMKLEVPIVYPLTDEPWGVRRFFLRDPAGTVVNVLAHRP
jgi:predicted enzyme related to lactoylglutathione lyase